jgi:MFS family permease
MNITTFSALKSRNYRLFITGQSISLIGTWMQKTAVSWVIYLLTHSEFMLGLSLFASMFPSFLFSFLGGVVSDRYDRYKVLLLTQIASMVQAAILTILIWSGYYNVWIILLLSAVLGVINAFDVPARQSLVNEMVDDQKLLPNALALNSSVVNLSRLIGPAIAGFILQQFGDTFCFALNSLSFIAVISTILMMRLPGFEKPKQQKKVLQDLKDGFRYLQHTPSIRFLILMLALVSLLVLPFATLIPVYAKDIFKGDASTFGIIDGVIGLGAFAGALFLASLKSATKLRKILSINTLLFGVGLILFSHLPYYHLALFCAMIAGFGMMSQVTITNTLIQTTVSPRMRGRVISFYAMAFFGMQPLGGLLVGALSQRIGVADTVLAEGIIAILVGLLHFRFIRKNRQRVSRYKEQIRRKRMDQLPAPEMTLPV